MKKLSINVIFLSIVAVLISFLFLSKNENHEVSVTGRCSKQVKKDKFSISSSIKNLEKDSSVALSKTLSTYKQISDYLKEVQKENNDLEIETTEYSTNEKKEWNEKLRKSEKVGVEVIISFKIITSNPELLSQIAFNLGKFENVYASNFNNFVSDSLYNIETRNCIKEAMLDAKSQADVIALSLNQKIGKMVNANYYASTNHYVEGSLYRSAKFAMNSDTDATPATIFSGSSEIDVSVDVKFELK